MAITKTAIYNAAMFLLGQPRSADITTDTSSNATRFNDIYAQSRDEALRAHIWNCAKWRTVLGENLLTYSEAFSNAAWTKTNVSVTADQLRAPDGQTTADLLEDSDGANAGTVAQAVTVANDSDTHTLPVHLKQGTAAVTRVLFAYSGGTGVSQAVDVTWGATPTVSAGTIESIVGGWWRVSVPLANNASGNTALTATIYPAGATASATGTVYAWGAQITRTTAKVGYVATTATAKQPIYPPFGYTYGHALPDDWIRTVEVNEGERDYQIEGNYLLTDSVTVNLGYIRQITSESDFDELFARGLAVQLAKDLCVAITGSDSRMARLEDAWKKATGKAETADAQEDGQEAPLADPWVRSRHGGMGWR